MALPYNMLLLSVQYSRITVTEERPMVHGTRGSFTAEKFDLRYTVAFFKI